MKAVLTAAAFLSACASLDIKSHIRTISNLEERIENRNVETIRQKYQKDPEAYKNEMVNMLFRQLYQKNIPLAEEIGKLDVFRMNIFSVKDVGMLEDVVNYYLTTINPKAKTAFEIFLKESQETSRGIVSKHLMFTKLLQRLFYAMENAKYPTTEPDKKFKHPKPYSMDKLIDDFFDFQDKSKWGSLSDVKRRVNTPEEVYNYMLWNIVYYSDMGRNEVLTPSQTLDRKKGDCEDHANLGAFLLEGYDPKVVLIKYEKGLEIGSGVEKYSSAGHATITFKNAGELYNLENGTTPRAKRMRGIIGPFKSPKDVASFSSMDLGVTKYVADNWYMLDQHFQNKWWGSP